MAASNRDGKTDGTPREGLLVEYLDGGLPNAVPGFCFSSRPLHLQIRAAERDLMAQGEPIAAGKEAAMGAGIELRLSSIPWRVISTPTPTGERQRRGLPRLSRTLAHPVSMSQF
jgi:hypothetical protein